MTNEEKTAFGEMRKDVTKILFYLESDKTTNQKGLVERVKEIEGKLDELVVENKILKAKAATYGVIGGALLSGLIWLAKLLLTRFL